jgi:putative methionine-R-sulfoxide reductase with GAF domain
MNRDISSAEVIERQAPTWLDANDALGSAVKHIAALSPTFNWVGIYVLNGDMLELGPYIGASTEHTRNAFNPSLEAAVKHIADDLGDFWPKPEARRERA